MANIFILLIIGFPWLGALIVWLIGDARPKIQHTFAVAFSLLSGISSLILLAFINSQPAIDLSLGTSFGNLTFTPDGLAVSLTVIATVVGSLAVFFSVD